MNKITLMIEKNPKSSNEEDLIKCNGNMSQIYKFIHSVTKSKCHVKQPNDLDADMFNLYLSSIGNLTVESLDSTPQEMLWKGSVKQTKL